MPFCIPHRWLIPLVLCAGLWGCAYQHNLRQGDAAAAKGAYREALEAYSAAGREKVRPRENDLEQRMASVRHAWAEDLLRRAARAPRATAAYLAGRAAELDPARRGLATELSEKALGDGALAVVARPRHPEAAPAVEQLHKGLEAQGLARTVTLTTAANVERAVPTLEIDFFVTTPTVQLETTLRTKRVSYKAGTVEAVNPAYTAQQARLKAQQTAVKAAQLKARNEEDDMLILTRVSGRELSRNDEGQLRLRYDDARRAAQAAEAQLAREQELLRRIPATIEQPVLKPYDFNMQVHLLRGSGLLGGRLRDTMGEEMRLEHPLEMAASYEEYPAQPTAKLPASVPRIPTDEEVRDVLVQQAGNYLAEKVRSAMGRMADDLQLRVEDGARPTDERLEAASQLLLLHGELLSTEARENIRRQAAELAGLPVSF